jgi:hypothetical protein
MKDEQEPVPVEIEGGGQTWFYVCGECHGIVSILDRKCPHCKRWLNWDE